VAQVKTAIARAIDWDLRHLASQASGVLHATARALRLLGDRLDDLERDAPSTTDRLLLELGTAVGRHLPPPGEWAAFSRGHLPERGRVLHAECGDGWLVGALQAAGLDVYGADPDQHLVLAAPTGVVDLRVDGARDHLRALATGGLAGVILSNCVDRLPPAALVQLVDLALSRLAAEGRLVIISHHPEHWGKGQQTTLADLAGGQPWYPTTWLRVLAERGWHAVASHPVSAEGFAITATR
jgi:hypothetical protein